MCELFIHLFIYSGANEANKAWDDNAQGKWEGGRETKGEWERHTTNSRLAIVLTPPHPTNRRTRLELQLNLLIPSIATWVLCFSFIFQLFSVPISSRYLHNFVPICFHFVPFELFIHTLQPQFVKRECSVNAFDYSSRVRVESSSSSSFIELTMQFISGAYKLH